MKQGYSYNTPGGGLWLNSITNANNETTNYVYNNQDQVTTITDPLNNKTTFTYTTSGQVATITDANNGLTKFTYDASNNSACSGLASPAEPCTVVTDPNGHTTTYAYNGNLQVNAALDALGHMTSSTVNALTYNVTASTDALSSQSSYGYDNNNDLLSETDGSKASITFTYPSSINGSQAPNVLYQPLTQTTAINSNTNSVTNYQYDNNGNVLSSIDKASNHGSSYTYNADGTASSMTDGDTNVTLYGYDTNGNLTTVTPPGPVGKTTLTYDALSRLSTEKDGNGNTTTYNYDNENRVTKITYQGGTSVSYSYDKDGNALSEIDSTGTTKFGYDVLNRQTTKTLPSSLIITNGYDKVGNLTSLTDASGQVSYVYDQANRMTTLTDANGLKTIYTYDNANRKTSIQYPNGTGQTMTYDGAGRELTNTGGKGTITVNGSGQATFSGTRYTNYAYTYTSGSTSTALLQQTSVLDPVGQVNTNTLAYTYNTQNELTNVLRTTGGSSNGQWAYQYDGNGNRTNLTYTNQTQHSYTYAYNAANELTQAKGSYTDLNKTTTTMTLTYQYDNNGNETSLATTGSTPPDAASLSRTETLNTANQNTGGSSTHGTYTYGYSGSNQTERVSNNAQTDIYTSLGLSSEKSASGTTEYVRCSCGLLNSLHTPDGKKYYYLFDGEGSIVGVTDISGNDVNRYDYDPFGTAMGPWQVQVSQPWTYAGGYYDSLTGLYKFGIRYYDSTTARWTQRTPIAGSLQETTKANPYEYADDNPVNKVDPSGKDGILDSFDTCITGGFDSVAKFLETVAFVSGVGAGIATSAAAAAAPVLGDIAIIAGVATITYCGLHAVDPNHNLQI